MKIKHGIHQNRIKNGSVEYDFVYEFYWMGEKVTQDDFNERLLSMTKSAGNDMDWLLKGMELKASINEGDKTVAQLEALEAMAKLPFCDACRKLIGAAT